MDTLRSLPQGSSLGEKQHSRLKDPSFERESVHPGKIFRESRFIRGHGITLYPPLVLSLIKEMP